MFLEKTRSEHSPVLQISIYNYYMNQWINHRTPQHPLFRETPTKDRAQRGAGPMATLNYTMAALDLLAKIHQRYFPLDIHEKSYCDTPPIHQVISWFLSLWHNS